MKQKTNALTRVLTLLLLVSFFLIGNAQTASVDGVLQKWHKIAVSLTLPGSNLSESVNTFRNNRMDVIFTSPSGRNIRVPGYFAADGNAANSNAKSGRVYRAILRPDELGAWSYRILYYTGNNIAISNVNSLPNPTYNLTGTIGNIRTSNKNAPDFRAKGRLLYQTTGTSKQRRYLRFAETGEYYLKLGPDSPENFLNYNDFDADVAGNINSGFTPEHQFTPHASDFNSGNPTWDGGKGRNIIGALNYLKNQQMNSVSMSLFGGDDKNVYPWTRPSDKFIYDVSKLEQWEIVLNHAEQNGLLLHLKLAENENWSALNSNEIKTYYREMIARFGHHLAIEWNISEEYRGTPASAIERIDFLAANDPWQNPRVIHTYPDEHNKYATWLSLDAKLTGASIQSSSKSNYASAYNGPDGILTWINNSKNDGTPWVVASDEQNPGSTGIFTSQNINVSSVKTEARTRILWKTLIAGGPGVMWYGGGQGDFKTENFNRFNTLFNWSRYAIIDFFQNNNIEFWKTENNDNLVSGSANCLADAGRTYVIYLENGGATNLNLNGQSGNFSVQWFDPRNGGALLNGSVSQVVGGGNRSIGNPPNATSSDWVALVRQNGSDPVSGVRITQASISVDEGRTSRLNASVTPSTAANRDVNWRSSNTSIATVDGNGLVRGIAPGTATITVTTADGGFTASSTVTVIAPVAVSGAWVESDGYLVIDTESLEFPPNSLWSKKPSGGNDPWGDGFIQYDGPDRQFVAPLPDGVLKFDIVINTPGTYQFIWRTGYGFNSQTFDGANDSWLKINGTDFYGRKGTQRVPNLNEWMKVWVQKDAFVNECFGEHRGVNGMTIFADFDAPGNYTIEIAGRSQGHVIDRLFLFQQGKRDLAFTNNGPESPREGGANIAVTGITIAPSAVAIDVNQTSALIPNFTPADATNREVTWSSSNNSIARVDSSTGVVTGVSGGVATITATTADGGFTATSTITVANGDASCSDVTLSAVDDFVNKELPGFAPGYIDNVRNALAIDASRFKNQFAAATTSFSGESGTYNITLNTLTETDGESTYRVFINNTLIGTYQNPTTTTDYTPSSTTFNTINVPNEAVLRVEFNSNTNGNIPEGDSTAFSRGRWTSLVFECTDNPIPTGDGILLGNLSNTGGTPDGWKSNLVINKSDTYTNTTGATQVLQVDKFVFYAQKIADPVTPFIVKVNGVDDFTVLAIGTTRTASAYTTGENDLAFNTGAAKTITLANGETIATGFLDANADGSGGNIGSVIPFSTQGTTDELWYSGGPNSGDSGSVSEGNAPISGLNTIPNLNRDYRYRMVLSEAQPIADCSSAPSGLRVTSVTETSATLSFDNTPNDGRKFELRSYVSGTFDGNINTPSVSFALASEGSTSITVSGLMAGTVYDFVLRSLCGPGGNGPSPVAPLVSATTLGGVISVTGVGLSSQNVTIEIGQTATITATVTPANADNKAVNWTSSNPAIASVSASGQITALTAGNATVTVTTADGSFTASASITVNAPAPTADCSEIPSNFEFVSATETTATFSFDNTPRDTRIIELRSYSPGSFNGNVSVGAISYGQASAGNTTITIAGLEPAAQYDFVYRALCGPGGNGPSGTGIITASTQGFVPVMDCSNPPTGLVVSNTTDTTVTISFPNSPDDKRIFELRAFLEGTFVSSINEPSQAFASSPAGSTSITMQNLQPGTSYDFVFRALCIGETPQNSQISPVIVAATTASFQAKSIQKIGLYPNPASDFVTLSGIDKQDVIFVRDISGRSVIKNIKAKGNSVQLNVSSLEMGVYFVSTKNKTFRFVKN